MKIATIAVHISTDPQAFVEAIQKAKAAVERVLALIELTSPSQPITSMKDLDIERMNAEAN